VPVAASLFLSKPYLLIVASGAVINYRVGRFFICLIFNGLGDFTDFWGLDKIWSYRRP
jgi:hypothetical protein